jgi:hypothetical protein
MKIIVIDESVLFAQPLPEPEAESVEPIKESPSAPKEDKKKVRNNTGLIIVIVVVVLIVSGIIYFYATKKKG